MNDKNESPIMVHAYYLRTIIDYLWEDEMKDYDGEPEHIFNALAMVASCFNDPCYQEGLDYRIKKLYPQLFKDE